MKALPVALIATALGLSAVPASAQPAPGVRAAAPARTGPPAAERAYADRRDEGRAPAGTAARSRAASRATRDARAALERRLGPAGVLQVDPRTGTARVLLKTSGALTGPAAGDRRAIARGFLAGNATALGLTRAAVDGLVATSAVQAPGGVAVVEFAQAVDGIPFADAGVRVALDRAGRIVSVTGAPDGSPDPDATAPRVSAAGALDALRAEVGGPAATVVDGPDGPRRTTRFDSGATARLVLTATAGGDRLAWKVEQRADSLHDWFALVDAVTGEVLVRGNRVKRFHGRVVPSHRGAPAPGGTELLVDLTGPGWLPASAPSLLGPNVQTFSDLDDDDTAQAGELVTPAGSPPDFAFAFRDFGPDVTGDAICGPTPCGWDPDADDSWRDNRQSNAVQAFYLANVFHDHLAAAPIGFTAASGAFEGGDRLVQQTMDGATTGGRHPDSDHTSNANMSTPPDGRAPTMQLYLFDNPFFAYLGDDAATIWHEYAHGLSNRLIVTPDGEGALNTPHAAAMGEGWSDWFAQDLLDRRGLLVDHPGTAGEVDLGAPSDPTPHLTRFEGLDCPVGSADAACPGGLLSGPGGFTLGDFGKVAYGPEVHSDGEIWAQTLWDLRQALVAATGSTDAGSDAAEALIATGMRLSPPEPTFLEARNAILAADTALNGGARHAVIWDAFAGRGMGFYAGVATSRDTRPAEDFNPPPADPTRVGTLTGRVSDPDTGLPQAGATVTFGGAATPAGGRLETTTDATGRYALSGVPEGTYAGLTVLPGDGFLRTDAGRVTVAAGAAVTRDVALRRDWAVRSGGADVFSNDDSYGYDCGVQHLIDGDRGLGWSAPNANTTPDVPTPAAEVELPRTVDVSVISVDPAATCGDDPSSALREYRLEVSGDGTTWRPFATGTFAPADAGRLVPIPAVGDLGRGVRAVRLTLVSPQSTNGTGDSWVDVSELVVHGTVPNQLPSGFLLASPDAPRPGQTVDFAAGFSDPDSAITGYDWDFDGDGTVDRSTDGPATSHAYPAAGTFVATVAARDFRGGAGRATRTVTVGTPVPTPTPTPTPVPPARPDVAIAASGSRGHFLVRVRCLARCRLTGRLVASRRTAKRLGLRRALGAVERTITIADRRAYTIKLPAAALRAMRARRLRTIAFRATFTARYDDGRRTTRTRTVRVRRTR